MEQAAKVLEICILCRLVHDETVDDWISKQAYHDATGIDPLTCEETHSYCPACFTFYLTKYKAA
jgi:hypothetical protein